MIANSGGQKLVEAARTFLDVRFRRQGRSEIGLDCLGLVVAAARRAGYVIYVPADLPYRGLCEQQVEELFHLAGFVPIAGSMSVEGDVLLRWEAALQPHLAVRTATGLIEAHAGIGRVIERPIGPCERWVAVWRLSGLTN